jgi:hypothetical protein
VIFSQGGSYDYATSPPLLRVDELVGQLDEVRRLGRNRRLRFQLPLGIVGLALGGCSVVAGFAGRVSALCAYGVAGGPWLLLLCVLPTDARAIAVTIATFVVLLTIASVYHTILLLLLDGCPPSHSKAACELFLVVDGCALAVFAAHLVYSLYLALALYGETTQSRRLPSRPLRATLDSSWWCLGSVLLWCTPTRFAFGYAEFDEPIHDLLFLNENLMTFSRTERATMAFILVAELAILGSLALWPRLRTTVQSKLASMGEGVAAASALSVLIGSLGTAELIARAESTFRAVRCDQLERHHLDTNEPAAEAYTRSFNAPLGSVDVRARAVTHARGPRANARAPPSRPLRLWRMPGSRCARTGFAACDAPPFTCARAFAFMLLPFSRPSSRTRGMTTPPRSGGCSSSGASASSRRTAVASRRSGSTAAASIRPTSPRCCPCCPSTSRVVCTQVRERGRGVACAATGALPSTTGCVCRLGFARARVPCVALGASVRF